MLCRFLCWCSVSNIFSHFCFCGDERISAVTIPIFHYSNRPKPQNEDRSTYSAVIRALRWGGAEECAGEGSFSQSDECEPSRDILEIISIQGYLWKIPAPYSGADNGFHTPLSDVDGGRIRFTQAAYSTYTSLYIVLLV